MINTHLGFRKFQDFAERFFYLLMYSKLKIKLNLGRIQGTLSHFEVLIRIVTSIFVFEGVITFFCHLHWDASINITQLCNYHQVRAVVCCSGSLEETGVCLLSKYFAIMNPLLFFYISLALAYSFDPTIMLCASVAPVLPFICRLLQSPLPSSSFTYF